MARQTWRGDAGFTLAEMLIASAIMLTVTATVFSLMNPAQGVFKAQPEVSDMQQRMRVGVDSLTGNLMMTGAGTYAGTSAGALFNYFSPLLPFRTGDIGDDPAAGVYYRKDALTLMYVPTTSAQTTIRDAMPINSQELKVNAQANCPNNNQDQLCGFEEGMRVLIFDPGGAWDAISITQVQDAALHLQYAGDLSTQYQAGSWITEVATHTYYLKTDTSTNTYQLMHYDGFKTDLPLVDNVVKLEFKYYGEPQPPTLLPGKSLTDPVGPYTTYGPKPPVLGVNNASDSWGAGENCAFMVQNGQQVPRLAVLAPAGQVEITSGMLQDGPWCPDDSHLHRFDADMLRVRRVRVKLRVQVAPPSMRGPAGVLFTRGGTAAASDRLVPDQEISFDVTPRNLNLGR